MKNLKTTFAVIPLLFLFLLSSVQAMTVDSSKLLSSSQLFAYLLTTEYFPRPISDDRLSAYLKANYPEAIYRSYYPYYSCSSCLTGSFLIDLVSIGSIAVNLDDIIQWESGAVQAITAADLKTTPDYSKQISNKRLFTYLQGNYADNINDKIDISLDEFGNFYIHDSTVDDYVSITVDDVTQWESYQPMSISGNVSFGAISNTTVSAYSIVNGVKGTLIDSVTTDSDGNYSMSIYEYTGSILLEAVGGNYIDPATGNFVSLKTALRSVIAVANGAMIANITPITEIVVINAKKIKDALTEKNILLTLKSINLKLGFDPVTTTPINPNVAITDTATKDEVFYAGQIGTLSQYLAENTEKTLPIALNDFAKLFSSGSFSPTPQMTSSANNYGANPQNVNGITSIYSGQTTSGTMFVPTTQCERNFAKYGNSSIPCVKTRPKTSCLAGKVPVKGICVKSSTPTKLPTVTPVVKPVTPTKLPTVTPVVKPVTPTKLPTVTPNNSKTSEPIKNCVSRSGSKTNWSEGCYNTQDNKTGVWSWYSDSKLDETITYVNGVQTGAYSNFYPNDNSGRVGEYVNGERNGLWSWYSNGKLDETITYSNGVAGKTTYVK